MSVCLPETKTMAHIPAGFPPTLTLIPILARSHGGGGQAPNKAKIGLKRPLINLQ